MQIDIKQPILGKNDELAKKNRELFAQHNVFVLDLLASPGSGKTSTILATIDALRDEFNIAVIEGDIASSVDAEKIKAQGIAAVQINTGGACHLESDMIRRAVDVLDLERLDLIIVENVGNLVCPTDFDLGENMKVMILSVPEGDDKPLKYDHSQQGRHDARVQLRQRCLLRVGQAAQPPGARFPHSGDQGRRRYRMGGVACRADSRDSVAAENRQCDRNLRALCLTRRDEARRHLA